MVPSWKSMPLLPVGASPDWPPSAVQQVDRQEGLVPRLRAVTGAREPTRQSFKLVNMVKGITSLLLPGDASPDWHPFTVRQAAGREYVINGGQKFCEINFYVVLDIVVPDGLEGLARVSGGWQQCRKGGKNYSVARGVAEN